MYCTICSSYDHDAPDCDAALTSDLSDVFALTEEQELAVRSTLDWRLDARGYAERKLGGYAGTGKTTVIRALKRDLAELRLHTIVSAFTGKAVNVLQRKGVAAQTLHSLMYDVNQDEDGNISFTRRSHLKEEPDLIIVDESSMISTELYNDLKSFNVPCLFVGDPGQLEPVGDNPNLMSRPDMVLEQIHRQAALSPIIKLANDVRKGLTVPRAGVNLPELTIKPKLVHASEYLAADQVICAKNKTRKSLNDKLRLQKGYPPNKLVIGDKLICLRNNRSRGVFNGQLFWVREVRHEGPTYWLCLLEDEVGTKTPQKVWKEPFLLPVVQDVRIPFEHIYCDFGYVITCHKSQGSEWDHVLVLDEWMPPQVWDMKRWRYTAITRAAKKLTYCI